MVAASRLARLGRALSRVWDWTRRQRRRRVFLQLCKAAVATVLAWTAAKWLFDMRAPSLAPWAALLTAQVTVYRSIRSGMEQIVATVVGVLLAFAGGLLLGVSSPSLGVVVLIALLFGRWRFFREQKATAGVAALFVMTLGYVNQQGMLAARIADVVLGVLCGVLVNAVFIPPLSQSDVPRALAEARGRIAALLREIGTGLHEGWDSQAALDWLQEAIGIDDEIKETWETVRYSQETVWWNPRRWVTRPRSTWSETRDNLAVLEQVGAELRSIVRWLWGVCDDEHDHPHLRGFADELARALGTLADIAEAESPSTAQRKLEEIDDLLDDLRGLPGVVDHPVALSMVASIRNAAAELSDERSDKEATARWASVLRTRGR